MGLRLFVKVDVSSQLLTFWLFLQVAPSPRCTHVSMLTSLPECAVTLLYLISHRCSSRTPDDTLIFILTRTERRRQAMAGLGFLTAAMLRRSAQAVQVPSPSTTPRPQARPVARPDGPWWPVKRGPLHPRRRAAAGGARGVSNDTELETLKKGLLWIYAL
jgi:hypothetical protein